MVQGLVEIGAPLQAFDLDIFHDNSKIVPISYEGGYEAIIYKYQVYKPVCIWYHICICEYV